MRKLEAVNIPFLHEFINVIIFPIKGSRPEQEKMGFGDLDEDIYWINWRHEFVSVYSEHEPFTKPQEEEQDEFESLLTTYNSLFEPAVTRTHIINNFIRYIESDKLGLIAELHNAIGDSSRDAIKSPE